MLYSIKNPECLEAAELALERKNDSEIPNSNLIKALSLVDDCGQ